MQISASGDSNVGTTTAGGGSGVPTGAGGYKFVKEGRLEGNCGAPLLTSVEGLYVPPTTPLALCCKFKKVPLNGQTIIQINQQIMYLYFKYK